MSDTERLEAAVAKLEALTGEATAAPWARTESGAAIYHPHPQGGTIGVVQAGSMATYDADFITTMDPAVGAALAELLRVSATFDQDRYHQALRRAALAVADAVLGVPASPKEQSQ